MSGQFVIYDEIRDFSLAAEDSTTTDAQLEADVARLALIRQARNSGATWQHIGRTLGMTGPAAKQHHKHLTAATRRAWYLHHNQEDD